MAEQNKPRPFTAIIEGLEARTLLATDFLNQFAVYEGTVGTSGGSDRIDLQVASSEFTLSGGKTTLGFLVDAAAGSSLNPAAIEVHNATTGALISPRLSRDDITGDNASLVLVDLSAGSYYLVVRGQGGSTGDYKLQTALVGDVNGSRTVDATDASLLVSLLGASAGDSRYRPEADANLDQTISSYDYSTGRLNLSDATSLNPLDLSVGVASGIVTLPDGTLATNLTSIGLTGQTRGGSAVAVETGSDGGFDEGSGTASGGGAFSIGGLALAEGTNVIRVRSVASDLFTQRVYSSLTILRDTEGPSLQVSSPTGSPAVKTNLTITGLATDALSGLASLTAQLDSGAAVPVTVDGSGQFSFTTNLALDHSADGAHQVRLVATDRVGNTRTVDVAFTLDTVNPTVTIDSPASGGVTKTNITIAGHVGDDRSGVATLKGQLDSGSLFDVFFDAGTGAFSFATTLALNGSADGLHTVHLKAFDQAGNVSSTADVSFTLDTVAPSINLTTPAESAVVMPGSHVVGTVSGTGSAIVSLSYSWDSGTAIPLAFNASTGLFDQELDLTGLTTSSHGLTITAQDAAGNTRQVTVGVSIQNETVFGITEYTPSDQAYDVGVTYRPKITFNQPVDPTTLNANNFYATYAGNKLAATIVPANDGSFAWLFFQDAMPNSAKIRITVDGSTILAAGSQTPLDADGDGKAGGSLSFDFSTVSLIPVANTKLAGIIADPGDDLVPHTADDVAPGPDGKIGTEDDVFLHPIAGVKVYLIGLEGQAIVTGADGKFEFDNVPIGNTKVVLDGLAVPDVAGRSYYYPEMVMDVNLQPGVTNYMMMMTMDGETMPMPEAYLPRIEKSILQNVDPTQNTMIVADRAGTPGLTEEERLNLTINVPADSLVSATGQKLDAGQVGISTVPPELVRDMLPPGVLEHTFDITVQAPGIATFSTPAPMTFPNIFGLAPGTQQYFLSFDHTTGRLVIEGTATVSADGKSVVTDPGTGITHPGWHGLVPPGSQGNGPGPQPPPCLSTKDVVDTIIDLGTEAFKCAADLTSIGKAIQVAVNAASTAYKLYNDISSLLSDYQNGNTCGALAQGFQAVNDGKSGVVSIVDALKEQNPIGKGLAISKCIAGLLSVAKGLCDRITATSNPCNTIITRTVCVGLGTVQSLLQKVNTLIQDAEASLKRIGLDLLCATLNQVSSILVSACSGAPSGQSSGQSLGIQDDPANSPMPPDLGAEFEQALRDALDQLGPLLPLFQALSDFGDGMNEFQDGVNGFGESTIQFAYQAQGAADAFYLFEYGPADNPVQLRGKTDDQGQVSVVLPPDTDFYFAIYDQNLNRLATYQGHTAASGDPTNIPTLEFLSTAGMTDTDSDGLVDEAEHVIGTSKSKRDTDGDGISDLAAVQQGLDPLGGQAPPIGIVGTVKPDGNINVQDVVADQDVAYLAAGAGGVQVVSFKRFTKPVVIANVPSSALGGDAIAVDFTSFPGTVPGEMKRYVAAALGDRGLAIIDVDDPPAARVLTTLPVPGAALSVQIVDSIAYVGGRSGLVSIIDMKTQEIIATFTAAGSGDVSEVKFSAGVLYTLRGGTLASYDVSANLGSPTLLSSLSFPGATSLFVGTVRAYVTGQQVFEAVDITNPSNLRNTSGLRPALNYSGLADNGSGRLIVGETANFNGQYLAGLFDVSDPDNTNGFLTEFDTPGQVRDVWIQNGLALIADGTGGLAIFNYAGFDTGTTAPTITVRTNGPDATHVVEGSRLRVDVTTQDDVQTRQVRVIANGFELEPDGSYPFSFFVDVPTLPTDTNQLDLVVIAEDTAGNTTTQELKYDIIPDTTGPNLLSVLPADDRIQFNSVQAFRLTFNEPLDTISLPLEAFHIVEAGADGKLDTADDVEVPLSSFDFRLSINLLTLTPTSALGPGKYELQLDRSMITDRVGNPMGTGLFRSQVTVQAIPFNAIIDGSVDSKGEIDLYSFRADAGGHLTLFGGWNAGSNPIGSGQIALIAPDGVTVLATGEGNGSTLLPDINLPTTGLYTIRIRASSTQPLALGTYQFTISDPAVDYHTLHYGDTVNETIAVRGDEHEFQFDGTAGDLVVFAYNGPNLENGITFVNPDGTVESTLPAGSTLVRYAQALTQTGTYRFIIDTDQNFGAFTVKLDQGSFIDSLTGQFNTVQNGTLDPLYNIDQYRYHLAAGDVITAYANFSGIGTGTLRLLDAATGTELATPQTGGSAQFTRFVNDTDRDILVDVRGKVGAFHTGTYSLTVSSPSTTPSTIAFGEEKTGSIAVRGDDQEWQFVATGGERITFGYRGPYLGHGITIKNPDNTTLATLPAGSTIVGRDLLLAQAGTYTFVLADDTGTGSYTLDLSNPADVESPGTPLTPNVARTDTLGTIFDIDVFTFTVAAGDSFSIVGEWSPGGSGLGFGEITLLNPSGVSVGTASGSTASSVGVASAVAGTYTVLVRAASGYDFNTGVYRLTAFQGAEVPTNDTRATAIDTNIPAAGTHYATDGFIGDNLYGTRDVDFYKVVAARGDQIAVALDALGASGLNPYLRLFDASGSLIAVNDNFGIGVNSYLSYTVLTAGTYYIGASSSGNTNYNPNTAGSGSAGSVGGYHITIDVAPDFTGPKVTSVVPSGVSTQEDLTQFVVTFNERLNPTTAVEPENYILVSAGDDGIFDTADDKTIALQAPSFNGLSQITLTTADGADADSNPDPLPIGTSYRLTIKGTGGMPIADIAGNPLNDGADEARYLTLVTTIGTPTTPPLTDGFEGGSLAGYWSVSTTGGAAVNVVSTNSPHGGTYHVQMSDSSSAGRASLTLLLDLSGLNAATADLDLAYWHRESDGNQSMPDIFSGRVNADGVAISADGVIWYRIDDLGAVSDGSYGQHVIDLDGVIRSLGLPFSSNFQILFQHYLSPGQTGFFDDIRVAPDLSGPTITSVSTPGPLIFSNNLNQITIDFSEPLQTASAVASTSYLLQRTDNSSTVSVVATYDDTNRRVTLATGSLAPGSYRLTVRGTSSGGNTAVRDANGNPLNNGTDAVYNFDLLALESPANDELGTATATGLSHAGGTFTLATAIGNNSYGGRDVDLYMFTAQPGDRISAQAMSQSYYSTPLVVNTYLRLFDAAGNELVNNDDDSGTNARINNFQITTAGTYYIGVSTSANTKYNPQIAPTGTLGPIGRYQFGLTVTPDTTPPTITSVVPHSGPNVNQSITSVVITFSEPIPAALASDPANYTLVGLGPDATLGTADDVTYSFTTAFDAALNTVTLTLTDPAEALPLALGRYKLTVRGTTGGITDLAGNRLNGGTDTIQNFRVIGTEDPLNDRLTDAYDSNIPLDGGTYQVDGAIGDNAFGAKDVDLFQVDARAGLRLTISLQEYTIGSPLRGRLRLFDAAGNQLAVSESNSADEQIVYDTTAAGTFYVGISGSGNFNYNPNTAGSGNAASTTGEYILTIQSQDVIPPTVGTVTPSGVLVGTSTNTIVIQFSEPMDTTGAESAASYQVLASGADRRFGTADDQVLTASAVYDVATNRVTLTTASPLPNGDVRLTLVANTLRDRAGLRLNGGINEIRYLSVVTNATAVPLFDPLDTSPLSGNWLIQQGTPDAIADITSTGGPRRGTGHLRLTSSRSYEFSTSTAILAVSPNSPSALELSFYAKRGAYEYAYSLPATFTGNPNGDGVAISTDGVNWYRVVDLSTQSGTNYDHYTVDLKAAATTFGLSLAGPLLIRFSNTEYYAGIDTTNYARYFDDIRIATGPAVPVVSSVTNGNFFASAAPTTIGLVFSSDVTSASANNTANYQLTRAGADRVLGTADDVTVALDSASYDSGTRTVTLTAATTLPTDAYQITALPSIVNAAGVPLNEGLSQSFALDITTTEAATNDSQATATSTGLTPAADGTYNITTAIGNNSNGVQDVDYYSLEGAASQRLAVSLTRFGVNTANLKLRILDQNGVELATTNTVSTSSPQLVITLPSAQTYYVVVSPNDVAGGRSLYTLTVSTNSGVAVPPLSEGFENSALPPYVTTYTNNAAGSIATSTNFARTGSRSLLLSNTGNTSTLEEANVTIDGTALGHTDVSFYAYVPYYEYYNYLYALNPSGGSFTGHFNGDGVSFSIDGSTWYPVVDFAAARTSGALLNNTWTRFSFDLNAAAAAAGVTLTDHTQIRFQNYGYAFASNSYYSYGIYIDDLRVDSDLIGPKVTSATGDDQFAVSSTLTSLSVVFNEPLDATTAGLAASYQFRSAGPDGVFDNGDDQVYTVSPSYDNASRTTTLGITGAGTGLPVGVYRLTLVGTGGTPLKDVTGNPLYDGASKSYIFQVFPAESPTNNTLDTATATGVTGAGGGFTITGMLGNDGGSTAATFNDEDLYAFQADAGSVLHVLGYSRFGNPDLMLRIFNSSGTELTSLSPTGNDLLLDKFTFPTAGTYYLGISDASNNAYDPSTGGGDTGTTRGLYDLTLQILAAGTFPFSDDFESGSLNLGYWDVYTFNDATARIVSTGDPYGPISGSKSILLAKNTTNYGNGQTDLTLHLNLAGQSNVELRFKERNNADYTYGGSSPDSYAGRYNGSDGVFISVNGTTFYRVPTVFNEGPSGIVQRIIDLDEFAASRGLTLSADTQIRFSAYHYYYDTSQAGRELDDIQVITDVVGPVITNLTHTTKTNVLSSSSSESTSTVLLNDEPIRFTATFNDRLNATRAASASGYELRYAGADGKFAGEAGDTGDDQVIPLSPGYDGNFSVVLSASSSLVPFAAGRYLLTFKGTTANALTDAEGNALNNGSDGRYEFSMVDSGPELLSSTPAAGSNVVISPSIGFSSVSLTFSEDILASSFTGDDVQVVDYDGVRVIDPASITVTGSGKAWTVSWPTIHAPGSYTVYIGPGITDLAGNAMNQYHDAFNGGSNDRYTISTIRVSDTISSGSFVNLTDQSGFLYDIYPYYGVIYSGGRIDPLTQTRTHSSTYSYFPQVRVGGSYYYDETSDFAYGDGGRTVALALRSVNNLRVSREYYVPDDGSTFARLLDSFTNPTNAPITQTITYVGSFGSSQVVLADSSGNLTLGPNDTYIATDDNSTASNSRLPVGTVFQDGKGQVSMGSASLNSSSITWSYTITVGPGQTVRLLTFTTQQLDRDTASTQASSLVGLPTGSLANLTDAEKGTILNFNTGLDTIAPYVSSTTPNLTQPQYNDVTQFTATFSEPVTTASANNASNYALVNAGDDHVLGTSDDVSVALTPTYDSGTNTVTLAIDAGSSPLAGGLYRLTFKTGIADAAGNPLGNGTPQSYDFSVIRSGPAVNYLYADNYTTQPGWSQVYVYFNNSIDGNTFTGADVDIRDANGNSLFDPGDITVSGSGSNWTISFPTIHDAGFYTVSLGPDIRDLNGRPMNQDGDAFNGENPDDIYTQSISIEAVLLDQGNFRYDLDSYYGSIGDGGRIDPDTGDQVAYDSYDGMYYLSIDNSTYYNPNSLVTTSADGRTIILPTMTMSQLDVHREIYVPTDDQFARYLEVLSNPTSGDVSVQVMIEGNLGSDSSTVITASGSGDLLFDTSDTYLATDDSSDGSGDLSLGHVFMDGQGQVNLATATRSGDNLTWTFNVTVPAGQTVRIMTFAVQQLNRAAAQTQAARLVGLPATALAGLSSAERASIVNFDVPTIGGGSVLGLSTLSIDPADDDGETSPLPTSDPTLNQEITVQVEDTPPLATRAVDQVLADLVNLNARTNSPTSAAAVRILSGSSALASRYLNRAGTSSSRSTPSVNLTRSYRPNQTISNPPTSLGSLWSFSSLSRMARSFRGALGSLTTYPGRIR